MNHEIPNPAPNEKEPVPDNARKFIVHELDESLLQRDGVTVCHFPTDWLDMSEDSERKVVRKKFGNGEVQMLLIEKVTKDGNRTAQKTPLAQQDYDELVQSSLLCIEKDRYEFMYAQGDTTFKVNYDVFAHSDLRILEVDSATGDARDSFDPSDFPGTLEEVSGDRSYEGYRVHDHL